MKPDEIIPDADIERIHANANFGDVAKRDVVKAALLQTACGFHTGHTARTILAEHGLITLPRNGSAKVPKLNKKGRDYLWASFGRNSF